MGGCFQLYSKLVFSSETLNVFSSLTANCCCFLRCLDKFLEASEHLTAYLNCHGLEWISMDVESLRSFRD